MKTFVLANRETVRSDVAGSFPGDEIAVFLFKADMKPFHDTAVEFVKAVNAASTIGETIRLVLAGPTAIAFLLGMAFDHSGRNVVFSYLDLEQKKYVDMDVSNHGRMHA